MGLAIDQPQEAFDMQMKQCPRCRCSAQLDATQCLQCGHAYRTRFVPPVVSPPQASVPTKKPQNPIVVAALCVVGMFALLFVGLVGSAYQNLSKPKIERWQSVRLGQGRDSVQSALGQPVSESDAPCPFTAKPCKRVVWEYRKDADAEPDRFTVMFDDGAVVDTQQSGRAYEDHWTLKGAR